MCAQLAKTELDMVIMGKMSVLMHSDIQAGGTKKSMHDRKQVHTFIFSPQQGYLSGYIQFHVWDIC